MEKERFRPSVRTKDGHATGQFSNVILVRLGRLSGVQCALVFAGLFCLQIALAFLYMFEQCSDSSAGSLGAPIVCGVARIEGGMHSPRMYAHDFLVGGPGAYLFSFPV